MDSEECAVPLTHGTAIPKGKFPAWLRTLLAGMILARMILRGYKLNDHDVELMAKCNSGEITRQEAQAQMINQY